VCVWEDVCIGLSAARLHVLPALCMRWRRDGVLCFGFCRARNYGRITARSQKWNVSSEFRMIVYDTWDMCCLFVSTFFSFNRVDIFETEKCLIYSCSTRYVHIPEATPCKICISIMREIRGDV